MDQQGKDVWYDLEGPTPLGRYLYHYTNAITAPVILQQASLRMSPYWMTKDPREAREWFPSMSVPDGVELAQDEWLRLIHEVDEAMRKKVHLTCFTQDRDSGDPLGAVWHFHRGWARARMWQQYADDHAGLCLIVDRHRWIDDVTTLCADVSMPRIHTLACVPANGPVLYEDLPVGWDATTLHFSLEELRRDGAAKVAYQRVCDNVASLFFRKNTDWESENEFRSLAIGTDEPLFVPLHTSLRGIVVGEGCSPDLVEEAHSLVTAVGREWAIGRCRWQRGAPSVLPI